MKQKVCVSAHSLIFFFSCYREFHWLDKLLLENFNVNTVLHIIGPFKDLDRAIQGESRAFLKPFICGMKKQPLPKQRSRFIQDDNLWHRAVTSSPPPRSCAVSAGLGNRSWEPLRDSCRSLFLQIWEWCMRLSTSVAMRAHYICELAACPALA